MSKHISIGGLGGGVSRKKILEKIWASLPDKLLKRNVMSSPPINTIKTTLTLSSYIWWPPCSAPRDGFTAIPSGEYFNFLKCGNIVAQGTSAPEHKFVVAKNITVQYGVFGQTLLSCKFIFDGQKLEIPILGSSTNTRIKVDGEYISLTPYAGSGSVQYIYLEFSSRACREIEIIGNSSFGGVYTELNDSLFFCAEKGPKCFILGDSFTRGTGATYGPIDGYAQWMAESLGWENVWPVATGAIGYLATDAGTKPKFRGERIEHDVFPFHPEILIVAGGINDGANTAEAIYTEASFLFSDITKNLPNTIVIVASPYWTGGVSEVTDIMWSLRDSIKQAATEHNFLFVDFLEQDLPEHITPATGILYEAVTAGASSFKSQALLPIKGTVKIGDNRVEIKTASSASGIHTYNIDGVFSDSHIVGTSITQVGGAFLTGTGRIGATSGYGNCDLYVYTDGLHPSDKGHQAMGITWASKIRKALRK